MSAPGLNIERDDNRIRINGALDLKHFQQAKQALQTPAGAGAITIDLSGLTRLDTAGAMLLHAASQQHAKLVHFSAEHKALLELVAKTDIGKPPSGKRASSWRQVVVRLGKATLGAWKATIEFVRFLGQACVMLLKALRHPSHLRIAPISHHIEAIGIDAIPIICLIAFVISIVVGYQGQVQLKSLGAEQYTVNLISISVLREMGVLLTAIMIAGRSGSAFTAEIGTMAVREEIDALRSIGFNPFELLVLPRVIAMLIVLPLLTLLADITGLFGGAVISLSLLNISLPEYLARAREAVTWHDYFVGMIKAPVFAIVIALVGCMHGMKVSGSAESVGKETTASVVEAIFLTLAIDGLFSVYFEQVGI